MLVVGLGQLPLVPATARGPEAKFSPFLEQS